MQSIVIQSTSSLKIQRQGCIEPTWLNVPRGQQHHRQHHHSVSLMCQYEYCGCIASGMSALPGCLVLAVGAGFCCRYISRTASGISPANINVELIPLILLRASFASASRGEMKKTAPQGEHANLSKWNKPQQTGGIQHITFSQASAARNHEFQHRAPLLEGDIPKLPITRWRHAHKCFCWGQGLISTNTKGPRQIDGIAHVKRNQRGENKLGIKRIVSGRRKKNKRA